MIQDLESGGRFRDDERDARFLAILMADLGVGTANGR